MTPFYVIGALTALWAVILAALGITRHGFPASRGATGVVIAISILLVGGSIVSAIVGGILEEEEHAEAEAAEEGDEAAGEGQQLELSAVESGEFAFEQTELEAEAGTVTLAMDNPAPVEHNVSLEGDGVSEEGETVGQGGTSTVTADVQPGEYTFYCSVAGHREGGMEGTLTVE